MMSLLVNALKRNVQVFVVLVIYSTVQVYCRPTAKRDGIPTGRTDQALLRSERESDPITVCSFVALFTMGNLQGKLGV